MTLSHSFNVNRHCRWFFFILLRQIVQQCLILASDRWCDVSGFVSTSSVSLQIAQGVNRQCRLLCHQLYLLPHLSLDSKHVREGGVGVRVWEAVDQTGISEGGCGTMSHAGHGISFHCPLYERRNKIHPTTGEKKAWFTVDGKWHLYL